MKIGIDVIGWAKRNKSALVLFVTAIITAIGIYALRQLITDVRTTDIHDAFGAFAPWQILAALSLTAISYFTLTFYDVLALRIIDKPLPWRTAALASFISYTFSHNLGAGLLTGGSARYRIYSAAGLAGGDIARVIAVASMTFWLGVFFIASFALILYPEPLAVGNFHISFALQQGSGAAMLMIMLLALVAADQDGLSITLFGWSLPLPSSRQIMAQIGIAGFDLIAASAALFVLVPGAGLSAYPAFFLGYTLAIIVALITHVPGGIGVFEAVIISAVPLANKPQLLAALIVYRIIYYLLPLAIGGSLFAAHEGKKWQPPLAKAITGADLIARSIAPNIITTLVFAGGMILLLSGAMPAIPSRMHMLRSFVPLPFSEASHIAASLTGTALLFLTPGLYRRLDGAFWLTRSLLLTGAIFSLLKGFDYEEAIILFLISAILHWSRRSFYRQTSLTSDILTRGWLAAIAIAVALSIGVGYFSFKHAIFQDELWWQFAQAGDAPRILRASFAVAILLILAALWWMMRPAKPSNIVTYIEPHIRDAALAKTSRSEALLSLTGDKCFLVSETDNAFLMYRVQGHSWIVMGDPIGPQSTWPEMLWRIRDMADAAQGRLLLYQISQDTLPIAIELGLQLVKYGEEARVDLKHFSLDGSEAKSLRYAGRRAEREGATFEIVKRADVPTILDELREVSNDWLAIKRQTEKCFSVGRFDAAYINRFDCAIIRTEGKIVAFANIWATANYEELSVDLMRHSSVIPYGTMDMLFTELMQWGRVQGYRWFNLGLAPLSGLEARRLSPIWARAGALLYRHGEAFYGFEGLRGYKQKFSPEWQPCYIAGPHGTSMARAMVDLQILISGKGDGFVINPPLSFRSKSQSHAVCSISSRNFISAN